MHPTTRNKPLAGAVLPDRSSPASTRSKPFDDGAADRDGDARGMGAPGGGSCDRGTIPGVYQGRSAAVCTNPAGYYPGDEDPHVGRAFQPDSQDPSGWKARPTLLPE